MRNVRMLVALGVLGCVGLLAQAETTPSTKASAKAEALAALKPPPGAKVAIVEFDDLECPYCAHAVPVIEKAAAEYRIPVIHHDYPLTEIHAWSFDAAVTARYLQDSVSPKIADEFRQAVFRNQNAISNKEDLAQFTQRWFLAHHVAEPFVMDASGKCTREMPLNGRHRQ
jgi:protein-disulfide isomerase